jgi:hypothetical protein
MLREVLSCAVMPSCDGWSAKSFRSWGRSPSRIVLTRLRPRQDGEFHEIGLAVGVERQCGQMGEVIGTMCAGNEEASASPPQEGLLDAPDSLRDLPSPVADLRPRQVPGLDITRALRMPYSADASTPDRR